MITWPPWRDSLNVLKEKNKIMNKNEFALKCMEIVNDDSASQPSTGPMIRTRNFNENGDRMFWDPEGEEEFDANEMITFFNIMMNDPDNFYEDRPIGDTESTILLHKGNELGFITEKTPKTW